MSMITKYSLLTNQGKSCSGSEVRRAGAPYTGGGVSAGLAPQATQKQKIPLPLKNPHYPNNNINVINHDVININLPW